MHKPGNIYRACAFSTDSMMKRKNFPARYRPLYNLTIEEAKDYLANNVLIGDQNARITELRVRDLDDPRDYAEFMDWRIERLNVSIKNGRICDTRGAG